MRNSKKYWLIIILISALGLKVISCNIHYDNPNDSENKWSLRKEFLTSQIQFYQPDFVGTQEGKLHQLQYLDSTLANYNFIGRGRIIQKTKENLVLYFIILKSSKLLIKLRFGYHKHPMRFPKVGMLNWSAFVPADYLKI